MAEQREAKIKVVLDVEEARRGLRDLNAEGERAAQGVGRGAGGGGSRGGGSGSAALAGAAAGRGGRLAGGGAVAGAVGARGMGAAGMGAAAVAALLAATPIPGMAAGAGAGLMGPMQSGGMDVGRALTSGYGSAFERFWFGDVSADARGSMKALEETKQAWAYAVGVDENALGGARAYFNTLRRLRQTEERGLMRIKEEIGQDVSEQTFNSLALRAFDVLNGIATALDKIVNNTAGMSTI